MSRTDIGTPRAKLRHASQVYAEAVAVIALREVMRSISDHETPEAIRQRIRDLIAVKSTAMGLNPQNFDALLDESAAVCAGATDIELANALRSAFAKGRAA